MEFSKFCIIKFTCFCLQDSLRGKIESRLKYVSDPRNQDLGDLLDGHGIGELSFDEGADVDLDFFKTCHFDRNDKNKCDLIKRKLKMSLQDRQRLLKNNPQLDLNIAFPCLLLNFELVSN